MRLTPTWRNCFWANSGIVRVVEPHGRRTKCISRLVSHPSWGWWLHLVLVMLGKVWAWGAFEVERISEVVARGRLLLLGAKGLGRGARVQGWVLLRGRVVKETAHWRDCSSRVASACQHSGTCASNLNSLKISVILKWEYWDWSLSSSSYSAGSHSCFLPDGMIFQGVIIKERCLMILVNRSSLSLVTHRSLRGWKEWHMQNNLRFYGERFL